MRPLHRRSFLVATLTALFLSGAQARAELLIGNTFGGTLYDVNTSSGAATNPRSTGIDTLVGIAFRSDGALFGLTTLGGTPNPNALFKIDPTTGVSTLVGPTGLSSIFEGDLAFDPTSGKLYGLQQASPITARDLFTLNTSTGAATIIGDLNLPTSDLSAMAFDSTGNLYVIDTQNGKLLNVNKTNAAVITSIGLNTGLGEAAGMAFSPTSGTAYVADGGTGGTNKLYTLNVSTGVLTTVGSTGVATGLAGLSFAPAVSVPEPSTLTGSVAAVVIGLGSWLRQSRATPKA